MIQKIRNFCRSFFIKEEEKTIVEVEERQLTLEEHIKELKQLIREKQNLIKNLDPSALTNVTGKNTMRRVSNDFDRCDKNFPGGRKVGTLNVRSEYSNKDKVLSKYNEFQKECRNKGLYDPWIQKNLDNIILDIEKNDEESFRRFKKEMKDIHPRWEPPIQDKYDQTKQIDRRWNSFVREIELKNKKINDE